MPAGATNTILMHLLFLEYASGPYAGGGSGGSNEPPRLPRSSGLNPLTFLPSFSYVHEA